MLPKNPLTMRGTLTRCWLFTYQTPIAAVLPLLPRNLELVTHRECAFWNVVVCRIQSMRPSHFPPWTGINYWHVAYRLYVRFHPASGAPIEGLYFLRSDCDNKLIAISGNIVTDFNFHTAGVRVQEQDDAVAINIEATDAPAQVRLQLQMPPQLSSDSAFDSLDKAAAFLKYKPCGISVDAAGNANIVRIVREENAWRSRLVTVEDAQWSFFKDKNVRPEICYQVEPVEYQWNRGRNVPSRR
jgi:hypothetical protein